MENESTNHNHSSNGRYSHRGDFLSEMEGARMMRGQHVAVLKALVDDEGYSNFAMLVDATRLDRRDVRISCRYLARKGFAEYGLGLWTEDGDMFGSGYRATPAGVSALKELA